MPFCPCPSDRTTQPFLTTPPGAQLDAGDYRKQAGTRLLAASYPRRPSPGQKPLNPETACALFCGLSWLISLVALTLAIYALLPIPAVFYIGMVAAVLVIPLFLLVAALRRRRGSSPAG